MLRQLLARHAHAKGRKIAGIWLCCRPGRSAPAAQCGQRRECTGQRGAVRARFWEGMPAGSKRQQRFPLFPAVACRFEVSFHCCPCLQRAILPEEVWALSRQSCNVNPKTQATHRMPSPLVAALSKNELLATGPRAASIPAVSRVSGQPQVPDPWSPAESDTRESPRGNQKVCRPPVLQQRLARLVHTTHFPQKSTMPVAKSRRPEIVTR